MAKWYTSPTFLQGFDHANRVSSFCGSKYLPKIRFSNVYFFEYENVNILFEKIIYFRL